MHTQHLTVVAVLGMASGIAASLAVSSIATPTTWSAVASPLLLVAGGGAAWAAHSAARRRLTARLDEAAERLARHGVVHGLDATIPRPASGRIFARRALKGTKL